MSKELTNSYGFEAENSPAHTTVLADAQANKAVQEIQAALTIAQKFPRNQSVSFQRIMQACERPFLADQALYAYKRGDGIVTGPSIRLAEVIAQNWGNMSVGIRELSQANGVSEVEAFAWDLETNVQCTKIFQVKHVRHTKKGSYPLTDPRDIYELVANQAARRLRACILTVVPGDIVEAATDKCKHTQATKSEPLADRIRKLILAFGEMGISVEMLEKRLGHNMEATIEPEMVTLRGIYKSIKDGISAREDFFDLNPAKPVAAIETVDKETGEVITNAEPHTSEEQITSSLADKLSKGKQGDKQ